MQSSNPNFACSLDGYQKIAKQTFNAINTPVNLVTNLLPTLTGYIGTLLNTDIIRDFTKAWTYFYAYFTLTLPSSLGYMIGTTFFLTKYFGVG